jgi:hypothetical protein
MSQQEFDRRVAAATGEALSTIRRRGFGPLSFGPVGDECREPLVLDWEQGRDSGRVAPFRHRTAKAA